MGSKKKSGEKRWARRLNKFRSGSSTSADDSSPSQQVSPPTNDEKAPPITIYNQLEVDSFPRNNREVVYESASEEEEGEAEEVAVVKDSDIQEYVDVMMVNGEPTAEQ